MSHGTQRAAPFSIILFSYLRGVGLQIVVTISDSQEPHVKTIANIANKEEFEIKTGREH